MRDPTRTDRPGPLVLLGIAPRSGTNYLYNLLKAHPGLLAVSSRDVPEDFIVRHAPLLVRYADTLAAFWGQHWRAADKRDLGESSFDQRRAAILAGLGTGMLDVLSDESERVIVTKTPSVDNLSTAFELFPTGRVLVLVRDGRAVAESASRSAGDPYELTMHRWAKAARTILDAQATQPERLLVVRYEDVVEHRDATLGAIFDFVGLDPTRFDSERAADVPVLGSSQFYDETTKWQRLRDPEGFDPLQRWADWPHARLERFDVIAGDVAAAFGYDTSIEHRRSALEHRLRSVPWHGRQAVKRSLAAAQRRLYRVDVFGRRPLVFPLE